MAEKAPIGTDSEEYRSLRALEEIEKNPNVSQRELASQMGVAVGVANSLIHTLVRKGMIKIRGENNRSITYHLTKKGLGQKARLAVQWTLNTIDFYKEVRRLVAGGLASIAEQGVTSLVLLGATEMAELAVIVSADAGVGVVGIVDPDDSYAGETMAGVPVGGVEMLEGLDADAALVCFDRAEDGYAEMVQLMDERGGKTPMYWIDGSKIEGLDGANAS
jgi:DNA-binding MarR family transcriptional regulator